MKAIGGRGFLMLSRPPKDMIGTDTWYRLQTKHTRSSNLVCKTGRRLVQIQTCPKVEPNSLLQHPAEKLIRQRAESVETESAPLTARKRHNLEHTLSARQAPPRTLMVRFGLSTLAWHSSSTCPSSTVLWSPSKISNEYSKYYLQW